MADGDIITVDQVKAYATIEHDDDDVLLGDLVEEAEAVLQGYLETPIVGAEVAEAHDGGTSVLFLRNYPVDEDSVSIKDTQGTPGDATDDETVNSSKYRVYPRSGQVRRTSRTGTTSRKIVWPSGRRRFEVTYIGGLDQHPEWDLRVKAELRASLRDLVTHWYYVRNPGVSRESEGGGMSYNVAVEDRRLPLRVREVWDRYASPL